MSEDGVTSGNGRSEVPFRARTWYAGHEMFGRGDGAVLIERAVAAGLRQAAELQVPHETGGLLYGRVWRDSEGRYVLVDGFVQAGPDAGKTGEFSLSPLGTQLLRDTAARSYPDADEVGWWHTHRMPSSYSQTDFAMQREFQQPASVGLLVYASGTPWATAYLGPGGRALGPPGAVPQATVPGRAALAAAGKSGIAPQWLPFPRWNPFRRARWSAPADPSLTGQPRGNPMRGYRLRGDPGPAAPAAATGTVTAPVPGTGAQPVGTQSVSAQPFETQPSGTQPSGPQPSGPQPSGGPPVPPQSARSPDPPWRPQQVERIPHSAVHHSVGARAVLWLAVCAGVGAVVAIIVLAVTIVSSVVHAVGNVANRPALTWSCHHNGIAPGIYACVATEALPPGSTVWWLADGKAYHKGLLITITVHRKERVEAVLVTPSGQQYTKGAKTLIP